jgi:dTDP-4-amino-4,6-dideoxygalactose transaminase
LSYVKDAFDTNWIAPLGPHVTAFEKALTNFTGTDHAVALSSGTSALHLALILLNVKPGDLVICQSKTFTASANPICYLGAEPVFVDSEPDTWNMDPEALRSALEEFDRQGILQRVKAIIPVHLYGMPARMDEIMAVANFYDIPVVEDAAESLGSTFHGEHTGSFGQVGILSFNGNKIITSSGGGALLSNNEILIRKARYLSTQARDPAPHYEHSEIGYNYRLSNVLAGIGLGQMEVLTQRVEQRRNNYYRYREFFEKWQSEGFQVEFQEEDPGAFSNRWLTCILINPEQNNGLNREHLRLAMEAENIESRPLWKPMHMQPVHADCRYFGGNVSEMLFKRGLCLPSGSNLSDIDFERIFAVLDREFDSFRQKVFSMSA